MQREPWKGVILSVSGMVSCKGVQISYTPLWPEVLAMDKGVRGDLESEGSS